MYLTILLQSLLQHQEGIGYFAQVNNLLKNSKGSVVYSNRNSLVGSIGVIAGLPNFKEAFDNTKIDRLIATTSDKLLERRFDSLKTGGFTEEDREVIQEQMEDTFKNFKQHVLDCRKGKIKEENYDKVLNADVFTGEEAKELGLVDEFGDLESKIKELYPKAKIVNFSKISPMDALK